MAFIALNYLKGKAENDFYLLPSFQPIFIFLMTASGLFQNGTVTQMAKPTPNTFSLSPSTVPILLFPWYGYRIFSFPLPLNFNFSKDPTDKVVQGLRIQLPEPRSLSDFCHLSKSLGLCVSASIKWKVASCFLWPSSILFPGNVSLYRTPTPKWVHHSAITIQPSMSSIVSFFSPFQLTC